MTRSVRTVAVLALLAAALPVSAYVRETTAVGHPEQGLCLWWRDRQITYRVNASGVDPSGSRTGLPAPCKSAATAESSAAAGMATWSTATTACTDFGFVHGASTTNTRVGRDGMNLVVVRTGYCGDVVTDASCVSAPGGCAARYNCWENGYDGTVALTTTSFDADTGELWDADIELFGGDGVHSTSLSGGRGNFYFTCGATGLTPCSTFGDDSCTSTDLQAVVTHEAGHMLGLDHECEYTVSSPKYDPPNSCATDSVMIPTVGGFTQRTLAADDVAGVCSVYPVGKGTLTCLPGGAVPPPKSSSGGCSSAGGTGAFGMLAVALLARHTRRRRA